MDPWIDCEFVTCPDKIPSEETEKTSASYWRGVGSIIIFPSPNIISLTGDIGQIAHCKVIPPDP